MDFDFLKDINLDSLKRSDLGSSYREIFLDAHSILKSLNEVLLGFESSYTTLLSIDREQINNIFSKYTKLVTKIQQFNTSGTETLSEGVNRAISLLDEVREFYRIAIPKLSELQVYFRSDSKRALDEQYIDYQNKVQELSIQINSNQEEVLRRLRENTAVEKAKIDNLLKTIEASIDVRKRELDKSISKVEITIDAVNNIKDSVQKLSESVKNFSLGSIASGYSQVFKDQANLNKKTAEYFGIAFVLAIIAAIFIIYVLFLPLIRDFKDIENIKGIEYYVLSLVIRLTVLFFITWIIKELIRNYNSNSHLYHSNTHRALSLESFDIIVRNTVVEENRDALVKQVAQTIFAHQDDGFLDKDKKDIPLNDVIGIVNAIRGK